MITLYISQTSFETDSYNTKFKEERKNTALALKPRIYITGVFPNLCSYICVGNNKYTIENVVTGFEILFKSFLALKCGYPDETKHIWQFIQTEVYEIEVEGDSRQVSTVESFIWDIKHYINNNQLIRI